MPELREYQREVYNELRAALPRYRRVCAVMPTGAGKSVVIGAIVKSATERNNRVLLLAHRAELIDQLSGTAAQWGVDHGLVMAKRSMNLRPLLQVGSIQTISRRIDQMQEPALIIIDEAHHLVSGNQWGKVVDRWPNAYLIGKTATPRRLDGSGLGEGHGGYFRHMVLGPSSAWLTEEGYLASARVFAPPIGFSVQGLRKRMGDFDMKQAGEELTGRSIMGDAVSHYRRHLSGQTAIAFCCSVAHAEAVAEAFRGQGVNAASIDGTMDAGTRRGLLVALGRGELKVLTSCSLIGEGVDVPSVAGCILLRPTQSLSLHLQMIGRCLRPQDGKTAVILDHVGNIQRLGHHLDEQEWTLEGVKKKEKEKAPSVKVCPKCFAAMGSQASVCGECGHQFAVEKRELRMVDGELVEVDRQTVAQARKKEQRSAQTLDQLIEVGRRRGMKNPRGWARHVLSARQAKGQFERERVVA
jgi:DNA repair protein RadD